jgi:polar amino acid transport system permease protein
MLDYTFQYGQIWPYLPRLIDGAYLALEIAFLSFCGGLLIGTVNASLLSFGPKWVARPIQAFVVFFTNTPQLVQIYFLYFALPDAGVLLSSYAAVLIGMTLNAGAYLTEIQRAGFSTRRQSELTGQALNINSMTFRSLEIFSVVAGLYIVITLLASLALGLLGSLLFRTKLRVI